MKLPAEIKPLVRRAVKGLRRNLKPPGCEPVIGMPGHWRLTVRSGNHTYRILYEIEGTLASVVAVQRRDQVYKRLRKHSLRKQAPSWRPYQNDEPFWTWHDAVIATDKAGRQRTFETWVDSFPFTRGHTLLEAKGYVEAKVGLGPLVWHTQRMPLSEITHYWWGKTTEFTDPVVIYWADRP